MAYWKYGKAFASQQKALIFTIVTLQDLASVPSWSSCGAGIRATNGSCLHPSRESPFGSSIAITAQLATNCSLQIQGDPFSVQASGSDQSRDSWRGSNGSTWWEFCKFVSQWFDTGSIMIKHSLTSKSPIISHKSTMSSPKMNIDWWMFMVIASHSPNRRP